MKHSSEICLQRKGAWLIADEIGRWLMHSVQGPLREEEAHRQLFRIETSTSEILFVSRAKGERGMRNLRLESISPA